MPIYGVITEQHRVAHCGNTVALCHSATRGASVRWTGVYLCGFASQFATQFAIDQLQFATQPVANQNVTLIRNFANEK